MYRAHFINELGEPDFTPEYNATCQAGALTIFDALNTICGGGKWKFSHFEVDGYARTQQPRAFNCAQSVWPKMVHQAQPKANTRQVA